MGKVKVSITATSVNYAVMFKGPGDKEEEAYVLTIVDPSKQIYMGLHVAKKTLYKFSPTDMVIALDDIPGFPAPSVGPVLLSL